MVSPSDSIIVSLKNSIVTKINTLVGNHNSSNTAHSDIRNSIPSKTSDLTNDSGYLTSHQDISGKANINDLGSVAFSNDYTDLDNTPTIPSDVSDLTDTEDTPFTPKSHTHDDRYYTETEIDTVLNGKQPLLVSGTNIKTINNQSLLGAGDITVGDDVGSFTDLQTLINNASGILILDKDYKNTGSESAITLNKSLIFDGNGHTIDADGKSQILTIGDFQVNIVNTNFINARGDFGAICPTTCNKIYISNCYFRNNKYDLYQNGAGMCGDTVTIKNCYFEGASSNAINFSQFTGAIKVFDSIFINTSIFSTSYRTTASIYNCILYNTTTSGFTTYDTSTLFTDKEDISNKTSSWNSTTNNNRYPTEKLVKDSLDDKADSNHTHGNITNDGKLSIIGSVDVSRGDLLLFADATTGTDQYKIKGSSFIDALNDLVLDLIDEGDS